MTINVKNVTYSDFRQNLLKWILEKKTFSTPIRDVGWYGCPTYKGSTMHSEIEEGEDGAYRYMVYSYKTIILDIFMEKEKMVTATIRMEHFSNTTAKMQGYCAYVLRQLDKSLGRIPLIQGVRGGLYDRHETLQVLNGRWYTLIYVSKYGIRQKSRWVMLDDGADAFKGGEVTEEWFSVA